MKEVFELFREVMLMASNMWMVGCKRTRSTKLFQVDMYHQDRSWTEADNEFHCSCVLVYLDKMTIPLSLMLDQSTKAKQPPIREVARTGEILDVAYMSMHAAMLEDCQELVKMSCKYFEDYINMKKLLSNEQDALLDRHR
ncbi:hypothetical protein PIB30_074807 [Stylosanthes scabra]|uniref:Uncharacterized protein n=1 Tax=Stylosanthes scabra TaxID=79078 RepID=A0ABU6VN63_9FABA|nr:hypothetical protein [Stylosanthes scabra]